MCTYLQLHVGFVIVGSQRPGVHQVHHHVLCALRQALGGALRPQVRILAKGHPLWGKKVDGRGEGKGGGLSATSGARPRAANVLQTHC